MVEYLAARGAGIDACGTHYTPYFVEVSCYCIARYKKRDDVADFLLAQAAKADLHTMGAMEESGLDFYLAPAPWATPLCYALRAARRAQRQDVAKRRQIGKRRGRRTARRNHATEHRIGTHMSGTATECPKMLTCALCSEKKTRRAIFTNVQARKPVTHPVALLV